VNEVIFLIVWPASIVGCACWATTARRRSYWILAAVLALVPPVVGLLVSGRLPTVGDIAAWVLVVVFAISAAFFVAQAEIVDGAFRAAVASAIMYYGALLLGFSVGVELGVLVP
jgi:hypothetical protein